MDKTKVIRVFETFAGIGAQHKAITNISGNFFEVVQTSEWDVRAVLAYSQIHNKKKFDKKLIEVSKWTEEKINKYLFKRTFSLNSKRPGKIIRKDINFKRNVVAASIVNNNFPDITRVQGEQLENIDLLTYSFPCQGLSIANMGRAKGIKRDSDSTSNLIWEIHRILTDASKKNIELPKYLIMENVKALLSKQHIDDYKEWLGFLSDLGYKTNTIVLNGFEHGALQKRERVFGISIMDGKNWTDKEFKEMFLNKYKNTLSKDKREIKYKNILSSSNGKNDELADATPNNTPSRVKMGKENKDLIKRQWVKGKEFTFNTLTCKQDRHPNIGMIDLPSQLQKKGKLDKRFITPREGYQIMGFKSSDFSRVKVKYDEGLITKESLYRQAGNSIVVSVLEDVFKFITDYEKGKYE